MCKPTTISGFSRYACLLLVIFAGCAVVNVDVDIYKGPLANHLDIQTEQVTAMAMGAKPLLISLRDQAECRWNTARVYQYRTNSWYVPGFIASESASKSRFTNDLAVRVNMILSLYEDRITSGENSLVSEARRTFNKFKIAYGVLHREVKLDEEDFKKFKRPFEKLSDDRVKRLADAYKQFLVQSNQWRIETNILAVTESLQGLEQPERYFGDLAPSSCAPNACFFALQNEKLVRHHASDLFPGESNEAVKLRSSFVYEVGTIAKSFTDSRRELARLWRLNLGMVTMLGGDTNQAPRLA